MKSTKYESRAIYKETLTGSAMHTHHSHEGFEVFQIWSNDTTVLVNDKIYTTIPGDIYFIDSNSLHWVKTPDDKPYQRSAISFIKEDIPLESYELLNILSSDTQNKSSYLLRLGKEKAHHYDELFHEYATEKNANILYREHMMHSILTKLLVNLNRDIAASYNDNIIIRTKTNRYIQQTLDYINTSISESIKIDDIAHRISLNKHYLCHLFRTLTGTTINDYITTRRLHLAKDLLAMTNHSIEEIAVKVGYSGYSSFSQAFKRQFGISPKKYQMAFK
jgi:AraC-like DNA-binding protein